MAGPALLGGALGGLSHPLLDGIMHGDIKGKNLLVGEGWKVKLCDFGFARSFQRGLKRSYSICGTEDWMAPESLLGEDYDEKVDTFSFGVVLAEVITRKKVPVYFVRSESEDFRFDRPFMAWIRSGAPRTLGDVADEWLRRRQGR